MQRKHLRQFFAAVFSNLVTFTFGASSSWASVSFEELKRNPSLLSSGVLSLHEASLVVSIGNIGGISGNFVAPFLGGKFGHRKVVLFLGLPQILSWLLIIFAQYPYYLYVARILNGFCAGAINICIPVFIAETSDYKIRGSLNSLCTLTYSAGTLLGFVLPYYLDYFKQAIVYLCIPIIFVCVFYFVPDSPEFLRKQDNQKCLKRSLKFYEDTDTAIQLNTIEEQEGLKEGNEFDATINAKVDEAEELARSNSLTFQDFLRPAAKKAILISIFLVTIQQLSGIFTLLNYTTSIFQQAGSTLSVVQSSIVIGLIQLVANTTTFFIIRKVGSKLLFMISSGGTALGMLALGIYTFNKAQIPGTYTWVPIVLFSYITFIGSIGLMPVPFVLPVDILPIHVRSISMSGMMALMWIYGFVLSYAFPLLTEHFGMHVSLFIFTGFGLIGMIMTFGCIPETKGKTYASIMRLWES